MSVCMCAYMHTSMHVGVREVSMYVGLNMDACMWITSLLSNSGVNMYAMLAGRLPYTVKSRNNAALHAKMLENKMNPIPHHLSASRSKPVYRRFTVALQSIFIATVALSLVSIHGQILHMQSISGNMKLIFHKFWMISSCNSSNHVIRESVNKFFVACIVAIVAKHFGFQCKNCMTLS